MNKLRLLVGAIAVAMPLAFSPLAASGAALNTFQTTQQETTPPLHGTNPHGQGTAAVTQLLPDATRPYSGDPSGKGPPSELLVVGRARGEQRADGTYHGHITIAALAGIELLSVDTNPGETKTGPLDTLTQSLCMSTGGVVCIGVVTANSTTTATGSTNHFETANLSLGSPAGVTLPVGLAALGAQAATADGNITTDTLTGCQTATGSSLVNKAGLGALVLTDVIKASTISKACPGQTPTETDSSTVIPTTGTITNLLSAVPNNACATGGNANPDGSAGGTANTKAGLPLVLDLVCNAADQNPGVATNSTDGGKQATSPYGVREALNAFVLALGGGSALVKLTTAAAESTATAGTAATCPAGTTGTPPNCTPVTPPCPKGQTGTPCMAPQKHVCNKNGDNDCVSGSGPNGPSIPEGGPTDTARDCKEGVENTPASKCPGNGGGGGGGGAATQTRSTLPFTGLDPLPIGLLGVLLLGTGLAMRRFSGLVD
ncbi:MAG: hypothetical protein QOF77_1302 [Solirubrobacteraceae bacterium]|nr:hypothetical protein [Solirubrobacteraceae bacterium]